MTRDEWIDDCMVNYTLGGNYDRTCRLIDSRIEAAMKRQAGAVAASPAPSTPGPERYGCRIVRVSSTEGEPWNVVAPNGTAWLTRVDGWQDAGIIQTENSIGIFPTESAARDALAKAPPPPGYTAPPMPDDATLRAAGWVRADAILALLGKEPTRD